MPGDRDGAREEADDSSRREDRLLAVRASEGDEEAFEELVRRHVPALLRLATRLLGSRTEAEDAVQESFVSAWRKLPEFRKDAQFGTWMHRIVTNRCLNLLRARRPSVDLGEVPEPQAPEHEASPSRVAESHAAVADLGRAMEGLSPEQRVCWVLRELNGLAYETIAETVGISPEAVRGRVFRARRYLTEAMAAWR
ncbi:sigma-70 family RNA polymerase sigma factor [Streptomyces sp. NPDC048518]|uniref:RNA polymerase sigma factor n=1 Tax=Streptomyces sp. NPDC048518 TaxID=3155029 RepID=UPI0033D01A69